MLKLAETICTLVASVVMLAMEFESKFSMKNTVSVTGDQKLITCESPALTSETPRNKASVGSDMPKSHVPLATLSLLTIS